MQAPAEQTWPEGQAFPQAPQFWLSTEVSMHVNPHSTWPEGQVGPVDPSGVAPALPPPQPATPRAPVKITKMRRER